MHARCYWAVLYLACMPHTALAVFDPTDVVQFQASIGLSRDNNLFRLPDVNPLLFGINPDNQADTTLIKGVGLRIDKLVSRQRLIAEANLNETTYDKNTNLDFVGGDGRLAWLWRVGNYWDGEASYRKRRTLGGFADVQSNIQDLIDTDTYTLSAGYQFHPRWRVAVDLTDQESVHSAPARQSLDANSQGAGLTLTYRTLADNSIGLQLRQTDRNYPNRPIVGLVTIDNGHRESRLNALLGWRLSGALRADAQLGHIDLRHDRLSQRDFSGVTWRAGAIWDATSKLRLGFTSFKDIRVYEDIVTSYIVVNSIGLTPTYAVTPKIIVQGELTYEKRDYRGDPGFVIATSNREDDFRLARLAITYSPFRSVDLSLAYEVGDRKSSNFLNTFDYQSWFGTVRMSF